MGSRLETNVAYIAGFLDGDGSLMLQIKKRCDNGRPRFMATICFYQDTHHDKSLFWIKDILGIGYISKRNDGMTELRINGFKQIEKILKMLLPYIRFKKVQASTLLKAVSLLQRKKLVTNDYKKLVDYMLTIQSENYSTKKKRTKYELLKVLGLTP